MTGGGMTPATLSLLTVPSLLMILPSLPRLLASRLLDGPWVSEPRPPPDSEAAVVLPSPLLRNVASAANGKLSLSGVGSGGVMALRRLTAAAVAGAVATGAVATVASDAVVVVVAPAPVSTAAATPVAVDLRVDRLCRRSMNASRPAPKPLPPVWTSAPVGDRPLSCTALNCSTERMEALGRRMSDIVLALSRPQHVAITMNGVVGLVGAASRKAASHLGTPTASSTVARCFPSLVGAQNRGDPRSSSAMTAGETSTAHTAVVSRIVQAADSHAKTAQ
jgi:hypothetical protein